MNEKIRIGFFGAWRGGSYISLMSKEKDDIEIVAVCDKNADKIENNKEGIGDAKVFTDFDEFLSYGKEHGMNAVFLANFFNEHAKYAIICMEAGMNVISECTAAPTLKECVDLCRCVERTGKKYMLAENYPWMTENLEMKRQIEGGTLGTLLYAEGEYNHSASVEDLHNLTPFKYHWRAWMPRTYYVTHAMGPVMYLTNSMPKYVSGRAAHSELLYQIKDFRHNYDGVGMMFCEMDNGMIARFTGCTAMASDYSRYRVCGDKGSVETGGYTGGKVRRLYESYTKPEGVEDTLAMIEPDLASFGPKAEEAKNAGHGGGDFWIVQIMIDYFRHDVEPFFNVYRSVAMSATAILGWRSALSHGENFYVPDFTKEEERRVYENDTANPFPDMEGKGVTIPCATRV